MGLVDAEGEFAGGDIALPVPGAVEHVFRDGVRVVADEGVHGLEDGGGSASLEEEGHGRGVRGDGAGGEGGEGKES